jgi:hypothetical protein
MQRDQLRHLENAAIDDRLFESIRDMRASTQRVRRAYERPGLIQTALPIIRFSNLHHGAFKGLSTLPNGELYASRFSSKVNTEKRVKAGERYQTYMDEAMADVDMNVVLVEGVFRCKEGKKGGVRVLVKMRVDGKESGKYDYRVVASRFEYGVDEKE